MIYIMKMMKKRKKLSLRLCALMLVIASLLTLSPVGVFAADGSDSSAEVSNDAPKVMVLHDGAQKKSITLKEKESEILTAFTSNTSSKNLSWQIRTPDGKQWVNISEKNSTDLKVTYSLIGSMLDSENRAYLRCRLTEGKDVYYSDPVEIMLSLDVPASESDTSAILYSVAKNTVKAAEDTEGNTELVTIVINYIFDNGGMAFEPYGASIAKGSNFSADIKSPDVAGYDPFRLIEGAYVDAATVNLNYTDIQESVVINVVYLPALVKFEIHHHLQKLTTDEYSESADHITTGMALTGSMTPTEGLEMALPGFKDLPYESITVAADGSTIVEIRYDRNYYLVSFDMEGGYGTEPIYTRYGAEIGANPPTKHGYSFNGWTLVSYGGNTPTTEQISKYDINSAALITVPDANLVYKANWITLPTTYTMVFWCENANDNNFTYMGSLEDIPAMSGDTVSGSDRMSEVAEIDDAEMFTYCDAMTDKNVIVEGDGSTVVNVYYTRNRYTITVKAKGLCTIEPNHVHSDKCYIAMCKGGHEHSADCSPVLKCTITEHTSHTDECIVCGQTAHEHSDACCGLSNHVHVTTCYNTNGNQVGSATSKPNNAPSSPADGYIYKTSQWSSNAYIYIKGTWYTYGKSSWWLNSGNIIDPSCGEEEHIHGSDDCPCDVTPHTHTSSCYKDTLHTHVDSCYTYSCGQAEHIHTDDCNLLNCGIPTGHTHSSSCTGSSNTNTVKLIYRKYGESIEDIWPIKDDNGVVYNSGQRWKPSSSSYYTQVLVFISNMPGDDFTLTVDTASYSTYTMNYYTQVLPGDAYDVTYDGKNFKLYTQVKANYNYVTEAEDFFEIHGYTKHSSDPSFPGNGQLTVNGSNKTVNFYYTRNIGQSLDFRSNGEVIKTLTNVMYGESLAHCKDIVPPYPDNLEANAYTFAGWYTSPGHYAGTEVNWETETMSAGDVMYYAKWEPIVHTVKVFLTSELTQQIGTDQLVSHRQFAMAPSGVVENGEYVFQGWFYSDIVDGQTVEKAFVFNGIPVIDDMNIYAKWSSHVSVDYTIKYVFIKKNADGTQTETEIADKTVGSAIAGNNETFYAKAGADLYAGYQKGYYPLASSHTVTMSIDGNHEYAFVYVYVESMPYAVRYINKETGAEIFTQKNIKDNNLSVVTETFIKQTGMMPDAYQKRLVLSASGSDEDGDGILDNNVITFYYSPNTTHTFYRVVHYIQEIGYDAYREYRSEEIVREIGANISVSALTLTGFSLNGSLTKIDGAVTPTSGTSVNIVLDAEGALIEFYYDRVNVTYTVKYLDNKTNAALHPQKTGSGIFGGQVVENAIGLTNKGYTLVSASVKQLHLSTNETENVIEFYYQEASYSLQYKIVGSTEGGSLSIASENISAVSGVPQGSTPYVYEGYHLVGWYLDESCTQPIDEEWIGENSHMTPEKEGDVWLASHTYYAKIEPNYTTLTITASGADSIDEGQVFMYRVQSAADATEKVDITVTVNGSSSVTLVGLALGDYTVTELTEWSYRYHPDATSKSITLKVDKDQNTLTFTHARVNQKWLDGNNDVINNFN